MRSFVCGFKDFIFLLKNWCFFRFSWILKIFLRYLCAFLFNNCRFITIFLKKKHPYSEDTHLRVFWPQNLNFWGLQTKDINRGATLQKNRESIKDLRDKHFWEYFRRHQLTLLVPRKYFPIFLKLWTYLSTNFTLRVKI